MTTTSITSMRWRKSTRSQNTTNCVEVASVGAVRDSKNPSGPVLIVNLPELLTAVSSGKLDGR